MAKNSAYRPTRRKFVQSLAMGAGLCAGGVGFRVWGNGLEPYEGKLLVTLQLDGGADVTQLCDPKVNTPGELKINNWADTADPGEAGNILYAPIADNANFFNRFGADMVVVNGVDAQTNSHQTGRLYNWTGSNAEGRPSLTALHAAANTPDQPLAYSVYGGGTSRQQVSSPTTVLMTCPAYGNSPGQPRIPGIPTARSARIWRSPRPSGLPRSQSPGCWPGPISPASAA